MLVNWLKSLFKYLLGIPPSYDINTSWDGWKLVVLIPAYNEEASIYDTIMSIRQQTIFRYPHRPEIDIVVVDDHSSDNTKTVSESAGARVIRIPTNTGSKARAQNYALKLLPGGPRDILVTIDADTRLDENALIRIIAPLKDPSIASACGFVIPQRLKTFWERTRLIEYLFDISISKQGQNLIGTPIVSSGCFSSYRLAVLKSYGGFPERSLVEDMDLTWTQLTEKPRGTPGIKKYNVALVAEACCYPLDPPTYKIYKDQSMRWIRGFLHIIILHNFAILKRPSLAFFVLWNLLEGFTYLFMIPAIIYSFQNDNLVVDLFVWQALFGVFLVIGAAISEGIKRGMLLTVLASLPAYFLALPVRAYLFLLAVWKQWILREKLNVWVKGH